MVHPTTPTGLHVPVGAPKSPPILNDDDENIQVDQQQQQQQRQQQQQKAPPATILTSPASSPLASPVPAEGGAPPPPQKAAVGIAMPPILPVPPESSAAAGTNIIMAAPAAAPPDMDREEEEEEEINNPEKEDPVRSQGGSSSTCIAESGHAGGGGSAAKYSAAQSSMPRNFRLSLDGYVLQNDKDGKYAAYRISVTAGLHTWLVLRRYRQFLSLHTAVSEHVTPQDMPHLPGKRILGSSVDPSFAEARGLALQVYLRQLVSVSAAWRVPQLTWFLDERASMIGVQTQIGDVLDQMDRMGSLCVDLQHQLSLSQMQVQGQNELVETLCRRLQHMELDYAALSAAASAAGLDLIDPTSTTAAAAAAAAGLDLIDPTSTTAAAAAAAAGLDPIDPTSTTAAAAAAAAANPAGGGVPSATGPEQQVDGTTGGEGGGTAAGAAATTAPLGGSSAVAAVAAAAAPPRRRASTGPTLSDQPYNFGSGPGMLRRMSSISIAGGMAGSPALGFGGTSVPKASIDMSDLNNLVKRVESANQLAMKVASDDEDDAVDQLLEQQHQRMMRSTSAYSLASNPESSGQRPDRRESTDFFYMGSIDTGGITQGIKGLLADGDAQEASPPDDAVTADHDDDEEEGDGENSYPRPRNAAVPITIPVPEGSTASKVWERLQKGGSLLGDPEERMMAEGQDGNTPGSGLVKDVSRSMFGLSSPPYVPPNAPRWSSSLGAMFGIGGNNNNNNNNVGGAVDETWGPNGGAGGQGGPYGGELGGGGLAEAEDDPLPLDILPGNKQPLAIDRRVDDLLRLLRPAPRAEGYRSSVFRFVTRQVKRALGAQCFPVGGYAIQAYLPDEEVGISAFLCHGQEKSWFVRVNETLCKVSSEASEEADEAEGAGTSGDAGGGENAKPAGGGNGNSGGGGEEGTGVHYQHRLSNVNFINMGRLQRIKCVVDNQVAVDIGANQVGDIATVALLEETDQLLGKNHLLKRSLLLIKSWWVYESRAYTGSNMLSRITEAALATMVLAVVNQHHARLHTPLQVMALFFQMHSHFDWSRYCWCIEGPRRLDTLHSNSSSVEDPSAANYGAHAEAFVGLAGNPAPLLLSQEVLNRYRLRHTAGRGRNRSSAGGRHHQPGGGGGSGRKSPLAGGATGGAAQPTGEPGETTGAAGGLSAAGDLPAASGAGVPLGPGMVSGGDGREEAGGGEKKKLFPIRNMNVMNPLDSSDNQIDDTVNRRRAARMHSLLQMGARQLRPVLMHLKREVTKAQQGQPDPPHPAQLNITSVAMLENFFALSWARFGQGWRPDVPPHLDREHGEHEKVPWCVYNYDHNFFGGPGADEALLSDTAAAARVEAERGEAGAMVGAETRRGEEGALAEAGAGSGAAGGGGGKHRDPFHVDLQSVRDSVKYCCFLLEAEVTDSALLALSKEILSDKGSLPVGEIGKLLQEATANASLSQTLKDQFGGLKKFLEKYPSEFVIAADHPFNPHVYLKSTLTAEELDTVVHGGTVVQTGTGGGGAGGGSGGGGAKKHRSKSSRRRSGANKQAGQQQQQQQQQQQHQVAGNAMLQHQHPHQHQQGQDGGGQLRPGHAQVLQQHMRAPSEPVYRQQQQQHLQQEAMHGVPLGGGRRDNNTSNNNQPMLSHQERQQYQQHGMPRQGLGRGSGGGGNDMSRPHQQSHHQQGHGRSGFSGIVAPTRIPPRPPPAMQQHHEQSGRLRQQQQEQQQQQQQQQHQDDNLAMYLQQSADSLVAGDLFRGAPQRRGGGNAGGGGNLDHLGGGGGGGQDFELGVGSSRLSSDHLMSGLGGALAQQHQQQQHQPHDARDLNVMWNDLPPGDRSLHHAKKLQTLQQGGGRGSGGGQGELRTSPRNDPWGDQGDIGGNGIGLGQQHDRAPQDQQVADSLRRGSGALAALGIDASSQQLGGFGDVRGEAVFKKLQAQQQQQILQQQQQQQQQLQQQQQQQGTSRFGPGLDGLLGVAPPPRDGSPFFD